MRNADEPQVESQPALRVAELRPREIEILTAYSLGLKTDEVASVFYLSPHTVRTHVKLALRKLGVSSRADAVDLVVEASGELVVELAAHRISDSVRRWASNGQSRSGLEALVSDARGRRR